MQTEIYDKIVPNLYQNCEKLMEFPELMNNKALEYYITVRTMLVCGMIDLKTYRILNREIVPYMSEEMQDHVKYLVM